MTDDPNDDSHDIDVMARTAFGECRSGGTTGMQAVCNVIMNRCIRAHAYMLTHGKPHPLFGDGSPATACQVPWQFSCWNTGDPNCSIINDVDNASPVFRDALWVATHVINGPLADITQGSTYYYAKGSPMPDWAEDHTPVAVIAGQLFFNDIYS